MKILHTSDWHLGKKLGSYNRFGEQQEVVDEICAIAEKEDVDCVIIAGDIFDSFNPPIEAVELFYQAISRLGKSSKRAVLVIAGNHDSPDRIEAPDPLARYQGIFFAGYPGSQIPLTHNPDGVSVSHSQEGFAELEHPLWEAPLRLLLTPYASEYRLKTLLNPEEKDEALRQLLQENWNSIATEKMDGKGINLLVSHLFFMKKGGIRPEEPSEGEKPIVHPGGVSEIYTSSLPAQLQYTALGHLHRRQIIDQNVVYSGSPLAYSFSEAMQKKYVELIELSPGKEAKHQPIELKKGKMLVRKKFDNIDEAVAWLEAHQNTLVELSIKTEKYLTVADRKRLSVVHSGIISIIPLLAQNDESNEPEQSIDPGGDVGALFVKYFQASKGQEPNEEILTLFNEITGQE